jgi:hypothetical protein
MLHSLRRGLGEVVVPRVQEIFLLYICEGGKKLPGCFEKIFLKFLQKMHPHDNFRLNAKYGSEEMDVICEEKLIVAECTLIIRDINIVGSVWKGMRSILYYNTDD